MTQFAVLAHGLDHPEGVAWDPRGWFYAGGEAGQLYRVALDGHVTEVANTGGVLLGLALDAEGLVYACDNGRSEVLVIDPTSGHARTYTRGTEDVAMRTPNYPCFAADGTLYVTDSGRYEEDDGLVYRVTPAGRTEVWSAALTRFPNGCCLAPDGSALYVVESCLPGVSRLPIRPDGTPRAAELVVKLPGTVPDGIAFDAAGALYISCYSPDVIYRLAPGGELETVTEDPDGTILAAPTNIAFGGPGLRTLASANLRGQHISSARVSVAGAALHYPATS